ncbi:acyl-CoA dehydrogenase FadE [soil metagenome]
MLTMGLGIFFLATIILLYNRASLSVATLTYVSLFLLWLRLGNASYIVILLVSLPLLLLVLLNYQPLRQQWFSKRWLKIYRKLLPHLSITEQEAIAAGTTGWAADLFSGMPDWNKLLSQPVPTLTAEEDAFLQGPVTELCEMVDDWQVIHFDADLSPTIWRFLKQQGFFSLIIPKQYGGKEFSALAHAAVITKLVSVCPTLASTVAVPNSLGPAELLLHYGTDEQKNYYLPRLATGEEIPCFALTGPEAGSDASAIPDTGIICKGEFAGETILGIRLNWNKRYITLAPIATVIGLAFKLYDPEKLLSSEVERGITCALIPANTPGVTTGRRHYPMGVSFQNGPIQGKDVFIPLSYIIGGIAMAGAGWRMLVECLSVGRGISLPAIAVGGTKLLTLNTSAYARVRQQFGMPIGYFEGIAEVLARIGGNTYLLDAAQNLILAAIVKGEKPAVLSAIVKYHATNLARQVTTDAMDIHGGKGICLGPHNYIASIYQSIPISITVEGANILTRSLVIFGQGAIRCHPYLLTEWHAALDPDLQQGLRQFDKAFFAHVGYFASNIVRTFLLGLTAGRMAKTPKTLLRAYLQQFTRFSAALALVTDVSLLFLGGALKRKESLSGRLGDVLSMLYLGSAVVKRFEAEGQLLEDLPLAGWACTQLLHTAQTQLDAVLKNFPNHIIAALLRVIIFPLGRNLTAPSDTLNQQVATLLLSSSASRDRISQGIYDGKETTQQLKHAMALAIASEEVERRLAKAKHAGEVHGMTRDELYVNAVAANIITYEEREQLQQAHKARMEVVAVDDFAPGELKRNTPVASSSNCL